jgi:hypothetical protein
LVESLGQRHRQRDDQSDVQHRGRLHPPSV